MSKLIAIPSDADLRLEDRLGLPRAHRLKSRNYKSSFYGAAASVARYCGVKPSSLDPPLCWSHGVLRPSGRYVDAESLLGDELLQRVERYLVINDKAVAHLKEFGIDSIAVGLPICYVPKPDRNADGKRLLVMPGHSLKYTKHSWNFSQYASQIAELRSCFDEVIVCVHPSCWSNRYWVDDFKRVGISCVRGADSWDRNALDRMARLFSNFTHLATNCWGSHVAYGAAFGLRTFLHGTYAEYEKPDFENSAFYRDHPDRLEACVNGSREEVIREYFPQLFCSPLDAIKADSWGDDLIGMQHKQSPDKMRRIFGWDTCEGLRRHHDSWFSIMIGWAGQWRSH